MLLNNLSNLIWAICVGVPGGRDRMEKGGTSDNRVGKGRNFDESRISG